MSNLPITLSVRRKPDAGATAPDLPPSKSQVEKTMKRDGFSCRCCGFKSEKFQRVVSYQTSGTDEADSLITVCAFCERCLSLEQAGLTGAGVLVWLPEMTQAELNHVMRALYVARASNDALSAAASRTIDVLTSRKAEAKKRLGTDDPLLLAPALPESVDDAAYKARAAKLEGVRFLPFDRYLVRQRGGDIDIFPQMMDFWTSSGGPFAKKPVAEWAALFESVTAKAAAV